MRRIISEINYFKFSKDNNRIRQEEITMKLEEKVNERIKKVYDKILIKVYDELMGEDGNVSLPEMASNLQKADSKSKWALIVS